MKDSVLQFTKQYIADNKEYISGNVAEHLIELAKNLDRGYQDYMNHDEIEEYENATPKRAAQIEKEIRAWINKNFNFDIKEFEYF
jgi:hypothetical protein